MPFSVDEPPIAADPETTGLRPAPPAEAPPPPSGRGSRRTAAPPSQPPPSGPPNSPPPQAHPAVQQAVEQLDGRVTEVRPNARPAPPSGPPPAAPPTQPSPSGPPAAPPSQPPPSSEPGPDFAAMRDLNAADRLGEDREAGRHNQPFEHRIEPERIWVQVRKSKYINANAGKGIERGTNEVQLGMTVESQSVQTMEDTFRLLNAAADVYLEEMK